MRRGGIGLSVVIAAALALPSAGNAATITVNATNDAAANGFDDTGCTLRDATLAANSNAPAGGTGGLGCPGDNGGGTGLDTILLQGGVTYALTLRSVTDEDASAFGDLDLTGGGGTIIRATGTGLATIDAGNTTVPGSADNQKERVLDIVAGAGGVTLEGIKVTGGVDNNGPGSGIQGGDGGGIRSFAPLTLTDSEVSGNQIGSTFGGNVNFGGGGILVRAPGTLTMSGSTVAGNLAKANSASPNQSARGAGIAMIATTSLTAVNSTISGNTVDSSANTASQSYGAGINWEGGIGGGSMSLTNVTIANNSAIGGTDMEGAGIEIFEANGVSSNVTLTNVILAGNVAPDNADCGQVNPDDDWTSGGNNVIGDSSDCDHTGGTNDAFSTNPNLGTLSNYGGDTRTMLPNPGSPAINRGGTCPATDQRGLFRAAVAPCDTGAVEVGATATPPPSGSTPPPAQAKCKKKKKKRSAAAAKKCKKKKKKKKKKRK